jgi:hypothetical protein
MSQQSLFHVPLQMYAPSLGKMAAARAAVHALEGSDLIEGQVYTATVCTWVCACVYLCALCMVHF